MTDRFQITAKVAASARDFDRAGNCTSGPFEPPMEMRRANAVEAAFEIVAVAIILIVAVAIGVGLGVLAMLV